MFASLVLLALGQVASEPAPPGPETLAERGFRLISDPANETLFKVEGVTVEAPEKVPELPAYLKVERSWQTGKKCGPVALYFLLRSHGRSVNLDEVIASVPISEKGSSLADLQEAAAHFGLKTRVVKVVPEELSSLPKPHIIHWATGGNDGTGGHFDLVVREYKSTEFPSEYEIIDTTSCIAQTVSAKNMGPRLSGYALIVDPSSNRWYSAAWVLFGVLLAADGALAGVCLYRDLRARGRALNKEKAAVQD